MAVNMDSQQFRKMIELSDKCEDLAKGTNTMLAPVMLKDFIQGFDIANDLLATAVRADNKASAKLKESEAIAYFDRAPDYLKSKEVKDSAEARKKYVAMDSQVIEALDEKAKTESMVSFLKGKVQEFRMAHDDVKKMAYSNDYNNSPNEGM